MKSKLFKLAVATIMVVGTLGLIRHANLSNQKLELKDIQIKDTRLELNTLKSQYDVLEQKSEKAKGDSQKLQDIQKERDELNQKNQDLQSQLQAKLEQKKQLALKDTTSTASAQSVAPVSGDCASWMAQAGITDADAVWLIGKESGCRPNAVNPSSGACGIPQALPCSKLPCTLQDPVCQMKWMSQYVAGRYGSWAKARAHHQANNWY